MKANEQIEGSGGSESQEELETSTANLRKKQIKQQWFLCVSEKISNNAVNLIRICFCIFLGLILASNYTSRKYRSLSNDFLAPSEMLLIKGLKGVFPPLQGTRSQLIGNWIFAIITENPKTSDRFSQYTLNFKRNGEVEIASSKCNVVAKRKWYTFYYNIVIDKNPMNFNTTTNTTNENNDTSCEVNNQEFLNILNNASIWTITLNTLYVVSEEIISGKVKPKMLIFKRS